MSHGVCPWWLGYMLLNPIRKVVHQPGRILDPYVTHGMRVMDIGCGMGFFSLPMARLVGEEGRVFCIDLQEKMVSALRQRVNKTELSSRIETRICKETSLLIDDLAGMMDFILAFAMVHEVPDLERLFSEIHRALRTGGKVLIAEPKGHVSAEEFERSLEVAKGLGLMVEDYPKIGRSHAALMVKGKSE